MTHKTSVSISNPLWDWIQRRIQAGQYLTVSDAVRDGLYTVKAICEGELELRKPMKF